MKVFKFGGASVDSVSRILNLPAILKNYESEKLLIVISAMGKTTNALEKVAEAFYAGNTGLALERFGEIRQSHLQIAQSLGTPDISGFQQRMGDFFTEVEWLLHDKPVRDFNYYYDQIVCIGELLSTSILSHYLNMAGITNQWVDVRDIFSTDDQFRSANIDWEKTAARLKEEIVPLFNGIHIVLTQGFIGSTDANESTTLGREGSDYSAAIFANLLDADSLTIWKDVEGVMNADPKAFPDARFIRELGYDEVIEMAFYGAQVIHPKTIKPLQNKNIPLHVKCFLDPSLPGTLIHSKHINDLPPIIVLKQNQVLIHLRTRDYSFVGEESTARLYNMLSALHIQANLLQSGAVTLQVCADHIPGKIEKLAQEASLLFDVQLEKGLTLLTIRHYRKELLDKLTGERKIVLQQWTPETVQTLMY
ncbi:MAG TPA: aspartate kinase [Chitinophagaceae bacterium]|jgi:aspartate kinase|nr:aspartate kinase [Chitinophagaceae bacterium]